jgi:hypothetical protein
MIDRAARRSLAESMRRLGWGRMTNDDFETSCHSLLGSDDAAIPAFIDTASGLYSDFETHKLRGPKSLNRRQKKVLARMILFLYSDHEYLGPATRASRNRVLAGFAVAGFSILMYNLSTWFAVVLLSLAILFCIAKAISIIVFEFIRLSKRPRVQFRWLGLNRDFFLEIPTWPFASFSDYRAALRRPPYLAGGIHGGA